MKKRSLLYFFLYISILSIMLYGCGGGAGAPGSKGTEDTGVVIDASVVGLYLNTTTNSVDVFQDICDPGPPPTIEAFTDHQAEATLTASLINPVPTIKPGTLYIDKYTVEYKRSNDSLGAPPIEMDTRFDTIVIYPPSSGTGTSAPVVASVILIDLLRKEKYADDVLSGRYGYNISYINNYTAIYTFYGKNEYGEKFTAKAQLNFQIGSFDYCK